MNTINPTDAKPGEVFEGTVDGERLVLFRRSGVDSYPWESPDRLHDHADVSDLVRLVPARPLDEAEFLDLYVDVIAETSGLERVVLWSHRVWAKKIVERLNANGWVPGGDLNAVITEGIQQKKRAIKAEHERDEWERKYLDTDEELYHARRKRDEWKSRVGAFEARLNDPHSQTNQDAAAWRRIAGHPALRKDLLPEADHTYAGGVFERITQLAETAEARTAPAVTRKDVEKAVRRGHNMLNAEVGVVNEMCDLLGVEDGQATDPVLDKAREYLTVMFDYEEPDSASPAEWKAATQMARHVLGQETKR